MSWESNHPSSSGVGINFSIGKDREDELRIRKYLLDQGFPDDAVQYLTQKSLKTGKIETELPNFQNTLQTGNQPNRPIPLPPVPGIPERSTLQNFSPMNQDAVGTIDYKNPSKINLLPIPRGTNVRSVIQTDKPAAAGRTDTPAQAAAKEVFKTYLKGLQEGFVSPDTYEILKTAAPALGINADEIPSMDNPAPSPTFLQKVMGVTPDTPPPTPGRVRPRFPGKGGAPAQNPEMSSDIADAQAAVSKKLVTRDEALKRLRKKYGQGVQLP